MIEYRGRAGYIERYKSGSREGVRRPAFERKQGGAYLLYGHGGPAPAPAHPFARPAFDTRSNDAYEEIKRVLRDELKTK